MPIGFCGKEQNYAKSPIFNGLFFQEFSLE